MITIEQQLEQLRNDKHTLVTKLNEKGVVASDTETFTTLTPKVGDIQIGGGDISEYLDATIRNGSSNSFSSGDWVKFIVKLPKITLLDSVTRLSYFFNNCSVVDELDVSSFNTSKIIYMNYMFNGCSKLISLDVSNFDTSNVTSMQNMFADCSNLKTLDLNNFDTSKVTNMSSMFSSCRNLETLNIDNFDTTLVTNMSNMFYHCDGLKSIDLSSFDTSRVTNTTNIFNYCKNLKKVIINNPNVFKLTTNTAFKSSSIESKTGYVYVPDELVDTYKTTTNWIPYASQIKPISELQ